MSTQSLTFYCERGSKIVPAISEISRVEHVAQSRESLVASGAFSSTKREAKIYCCCYVKMIILQSMGNGKLHASM